MRVSYRIWVSPETNLSRIRCRVQEVFLATTVAGQTPATCVSGNRLPVPVNPKIAPYLGLYPDPNISCTGAPPYPKPCQLVTAGPFIHYPSGNALVTTIANQPEDENYILGRIDYVLGSKDTVFGRLHLRHGVFEVARSLLEPARSGLSWTTEGINTLPSRKSTLFRPTRSIRFGSVSHVPTNARTRNSFRILPPIRCSSIFERLRRALLHAGTARGREPHRRGRHFTRRSGRDRTIPFD